MSHIVKRWIPAVIVIIVGLIVLVGYLFPDNPLSGIRDVLTGWAVIIASFAFFLGLFNVFGVHIKKAQRLRKGGIYNLAFLAAASLSLLLSFVPLGPITGQWVFDYIISPAGATLAALIVFTLTLAAFRLLRERQEEKAKSIVFILVVTLVLLSSTPLIAVEWIPLAAIRRWVVDVVGMAGMRGLLLGVALGTVITALRVLWPQRET